MAAVGWLDSPAFDRHINAIRHPEAPERLDAVREGLAREGLADKLIRQEADAVDLAVLKQVHNGEYVDTVMKLCAAGGAQLDPDTAVIPESWPASLAACGAVTKAIEGVMAGEWQRAFCSVRPPGHHAPANRAMGFCVFDNIAVGAHSALQLDGIDRVAILDWDAHHGNGTQSIFWEHSDVLYASWHQYPFYPGTGSVLETGAGAGNGTTVNCPLPSGAGDAEFMAMWRERIRPALDAHAPDLLLISAGFDAERRDPLAGLTATAGGLQALSREVVEWADSNCHGRVVSVLEGGYDLEALAECTARHVETLLG